MIKTTTSVPVDKELAYKVRTKLIVAKGDKATIAEAVKVAMEAYLER